MDGVVVPQPQKKPKAPGFWKQAKVVKLLQQYNSDPNGAIYWDTHLEELGVTLKAFKRAARDLATGKLNPDGVNPTKENEPSQLKDAPELPVYLSYKGYGAPEIEWAQLFEMDEKELKTCFDLRVVCAMFYASERIMKTSPELIRKAGLTDLQRRSKEYIQLWSRRFAQYTLAACLGEWRHRKISGPLKLVPKGGNKIKREAAQRAALAIWPHRDYVIKALQLMAEKFNDYSYFRGSGSYGGKPWAKIAKTTLMWMTGEIPDIVFADYVWDLSHNGGVIFNKCPYFEHEEETTRRRSL